MTVMLNNMIGCVRLCTAAKGVRVPLVKGTWIG